MATYILAIDQGTTSSRAIVFRQDSSEGLSIAAMAQQEFPQHFPASGWVEHEPDDIWNTTLATCRDAMTKAGVTHKNIAAIGITNQRETVVVWDRATGKAIHRAIVWQDRRTADICAKLNADGHEPTITAKTGLIIDPYFSGTKVAWILDHVPGARARATRGELKFGTIDSYLLWRLTSGKVHATDATNASRTLLFDIHRGEWDDELLGILDVPRAMLPEVKDSSAHFGDSAPDLFGGPIAIRGIAGDQQAAVVGQACFTPGMIKSTYGTGCFALLNTGATPVKSTNKLVTTIAYQLDGKRTYALEGSIFVAGSAVQWLRDGLGLIKSAAESGPLAARADSEQAVYLVPAFVGLGAPYWNPDVRGALFGLTRNTGPAELAHAALESVCYQTFDLWAAMRADWPEAKTANTVLRVDGGMTASNWTMQRLADVLDAPVDRPVIQETTALGAAYLAGLSAGICPEPSQFADSWRLEHRFKPAMSAATRERKLKGWRAAVKGLLASDTDDHRMVHDGYFDVPAGKIAAVVTHLEMTERPPIRSDLENAWVLRHVDRPGLEWFRELYRRIGEDWFWYSRIKMADVELSAIMHSPQVEIYALTLEGRDEGLLELDFRTEGQCELALFGVTARLIGTGAGRWLMNRALELAWSRRVKRVWLHTCTLDHPSALTFYQRSGFRVFKRQIDIADDPRLDAATSRRTTAQIPAVE